MANISQEQIQQWLNTPSRARNSAPAINGRRVTWNPSMSMDSSPNYYADTGEQVSAQDQQNFVKSNTSILDKIDPYIGAAIMGAAGGGAMGAFGGAAPGIDAGVGAFDLGGIAGGVQGAGGATGLGSAFGLGDASLGGTLAGSGGGFMVNPSDLGNASGLLDGGGFMNTAADVAAGTAPEASTGAAGIGFGGAGGGTMGGSSAASYFGGAAPEFGMGTGFSSFGAPGALAVDGTGFAGASGGLAGAGSTAAGGALSAAGSASAAGGIPSWLTGAQQALQLGSGINGLLNGQPKQMGNLTNTTSAQIDPRMQSMLYGDGTANNTGALGRILSAGAAPRTAGTAQFGQGIDNYLKDYGTDSFNLSQQAAQRLQGSNINAPQMNAAQVANTPGMQSAQMNSAWNIPAASMGAAQINAPGQNSNDLSGAYDRTINGNAAANPYLTNALQSAVNQTNASYDRNQTNLTNNLQRNILPGIGDQAFASGQYGGSRQGIAQGNAISDYTNQLGNSNLQLGLANSANTTGQQAQSFNQGQDRSLSAMNNLSGQQYGVATNNAQFQQQANSTNASLSQQANLANQANQQQTNVLNSGYQQQANAANYQGGLSTNMANAGYQNSANSNNLQAQMGTNSLNSNNQATGTQLSGGLLNQANTFGQANNNYNLGRATQTAGALGPFTGLNGTSTESKPLYGNPAGNIAAAATGIGGLLNQGNDLYKTGSSLFSNIFG